MKHKDIQDLHLKSADELTRMAQDLGSEITKDKVEMMQGKIKNINLLRTKMKNRARMLTIAGMNVKRVVKEAK